VLLSTSFSFAQSIDDSEVKFYAGGNFALNFGTFTNLAVAPEVYYAITPRLHAGVGGAYAFMRNNIYGVSSTTIGAKGAARFFLFEQIYAQVEYEGIRYNNPNYQNQAGAYFDETRLLVGGGYAQWLGPNSFTYINILWNTDAYGYTYFSGVNPVIKVGFSFGF
jgi:hypothetical protein